MRMRLLQEEGDSRAGGEAMTYSGNWEADRHEAEHYADRTGPRLDEWGDVMRCASCQEEEGEDEYVNLDGKWYCTDCADQIKTEQL